QPDAAGHRADRASTAPVGARACIAPTPRLTPPVSMMLCIMTVGSHRARGAPMRTAQVTTLVVLLASTAPRVAGTAELLSGQSLLLTKRRLGVVSHDSGIGLGRGKDSADDPVTQGGSLRVLSIEGDVFDTTY